MQKLFFGLFTALIVFSARAQQPAQLLAKDFMLALKTGQFKKLEAYLPDKKFYKSLGNTMPKRNDKEIDAFLANNKRKLSDNFSTLIERAKNLSIDVNNLTLKESIVHQPHPKNPMEFIILVYQYNGKVWDDLFLSAKTAGNKAYLLGIAEPHKAFAMKDSLLTNSTQAKVQNKLKTPAFQQALKEHVRKLIDAAVKNDSSYIAEYTVYRGDDEARKWKSPVDSYNSEEMKEVFALIRRIRRSFENNCPSPVYGKAESEKESEGIWIVQPVHCGKVTVRFAFLAINDKLLIGDIDTDGAD